MEDLKSYIETGVLELYVLGNLTESEKHSVEAMLIKYPELEKEVSEIESALESYSSANAIEPNESLKAKTLNLLSVKEEASIKSINKPGTFYKYAFAASVALLLLSILTIVNLSSQVKEFKSQVTLLRQSNEQYSSRINHVESELEDARQSLSVFHSPAQYKLVNLKGTPNSPSASMMVAFSSNKSEVLIDMATLNMPANDKEHQYQLWALVDGKPVDLGVFDAGKNEKGMVSMKSLKFAQAFAVTLEPRGGSVSPTMEQMMVMGAI